MQEMESEINLEVNNNEDEDEDDKVFEKEMTPELEEVIENKLREMNLVIQPRLKAKMRAWFFDRKIIIHSLYGRVYREVPGIAWNDIVENIKLLNELNRSLAIIKTQNEEEGIKFVMSAGEYTYPVDPDRCIPANEIAMRMKNCLKWFRFHELRLRLVKMPEFSYYVFMGKKDKENMNMNDIVELR